MFGVPNFEKRPCRRWPKIATARLKPWWNLRTIKLAHSFADEIDPWLTILSYDYSTSFHPVFPCFSWPNDTDSAYDLRQAQKQTMEPRGPSQVPSPSDRPGLEVQDWQNSEVPPLDFHLDYPTSHITNLSEILPWSSMIYDRYQTWEYRNRVSKHWQKSSLCCTSCSPPALAGCCHVKPFFPTDYSCVARVRESAIHLELCDGLDIKE